MEKYEFDVTIVGGGPAGMVCGLLLAEQGIRTLVIESHPDFQREYRGEVLMPRFLQAMKQIGLFDFILSYPHLKLNGFELYVKDKSVVNIGISDISKENPFILWMPQPVMLGAFHEKAKQNPNFTIWFDTSVTDLLGEGGITLGIRAVKKGEPIEIRSKITVGADGRSSTVRHKGGFEMAFQEHDFDILWFTIPKPKGYEDKVRAFFSSDHNYLALPKYPAHVQCGIFLEKGGYAQYRAEGIVSLKKELLSAHPMLREFAENLKDFSPFNVLAAKAERVQEWAKDGLILIGDAAHTCSPAGAIGVSVAVATAIVAADVITDSIQTKDYSKNCLSRVQKLREKEVKEIQAIQERASSIIRSQGPFAKAVAFTVLMLLAKTKVFAKIQRRLMVAKAPLPVRWRAKI